MPKNVECLFYLPDNPIAQTSEVTGLGAESWSRWRQDFQSRHAPSTALMTRDMREMVRNSDIVVLLVLTSPKVYPPADPPKRAGGGLVVRWLGMVLPWT
jgi:hypothetical protein